MILKASTRGSPNALARHLLNEQDNEHIEQHEVRGFMSEDVAGALAEVHAMSAGIKSRKPLFSVSLSPPENAQVDTAVFERTVEEIEQQNGLTGQPRITLFHEKEGRRHMHAVWSRIDHERQAVIALPFYKNKLHEISKSVFLEQGWNLPAGYIDRTERDPRNFDLALYHQAKREGRDPKTLKMLAQEAWAVSDNREAMQQALEARGLYLARGDRRGYVALTWQGEPMALSRLLGRKTKEVRERLGAAEDLRDIEQTRDHIARNVGPALHRLMGEAERAKAAEMTPLNRERLAMRDAHASERQRMAEGQAARQQEETRERAARLRNGLSGFWDRLSGRYAKTRAQNEREAYAGFMRDRDQRQAMIEAQLAERQTLQRRIVSVRQTHDTRLSEIHRDLAEQRGAVRSPSARLDWLQANQRRSQAEAAPSRATEQGRSGSEDRLQWLQDRYNRSADTDRHAGRDSGPELGPDIGPDLG